MTTMIEVIERNNHGDRLTGLEPVESVAQEWTDAGFSPEAAHEWISAGCWDAGRTAKLRDAGLSPGDASTIEDGCSIGYWYCNGDRSLADLSDPR